MSAVHKTHTAIVSGIWSIENAKSYLWVEGFNSDSISAVIERATNARALNALEAEMDLYPKDYESMLHDKQCRPSLYAIWKVPSIWNRGTDLTQHVDAVMHLIFLGIVKATVKRLEDWLKSRRGHDSFVTFASGVLDSVSSLNLQWCRVLPYKCGKFTGWISENYLALSRLILWFYAPLDEIASDPVSPVEPIRPQQQWTLKENKQWLTLRGLDSKGYADVLRSRVHQYLTSPEGEPPIIVPMVEVSLM
jgi:hypothetical protein